MLGASAGEEAQAAALEVSLRLPPPLRKAARSAPGDVRAAGARDRTPSRCTSDARPTQREARPAAWRPLQGASVRPPRAASGGPGCGASHQCRSAQHMHACLRVCVCVCVCVCMETPRGLAECDYARRPASARGWRGAAHLGGGWGERGRARVPRRATGGRITTHVRVRACVQASTPAVLQPSSSRAGCDMHDSQPYG
eukprot:scaffold1867_cov350-Prasinococcus_capsulatus_cf.AAC.1